MMGFVVEELILDLYLIFVFIGFNFMNGFIFYVFFEKIQFVDVKLEDVMWIIIGVGIGFFILFFFIVKKKVLKE